MLLFVYVPTKCRPNTTKCHSDNFRKNKHDKLHESEYYMDYMPYSEMHYRSYGWSCAQRRQLRSLAHLLSLFDPGFVLLIDDDTFVNLNLLTGALHEYIHGYMSANNIVLTELYYCGLVSKIGFIMGGAGYLLGRAVLQKLTSKILSGPASKNDSHRTEGQLQTLSILRLAHAMSSRSCPSCIQLHNNLTEYKEYGSIATMRVRVIDICANLLSGEGTCYHSDHAMSRCLAHGTYSTLVSANCSSGSLLSGLSNTRIGMCQEHNICDTSFHLTCHRFAPSAFNLSLPVEAGTRKERLVRSSNDSILYLIDEFNTIRVFDDMSNASLVAIHRKNVEIVPETVIQALKSRAAK